VEHNRLVYKIENMGIGVIALNIIKSYLTDRSKVQSGKYVNKVAIKCNINL